MNRICIVAALVSVSAGIAGSGSISIADGLPAHRGTHVAGHVTVFASGLTTRGG